MTQFGRATGPSTFGRKQVPGRSAPQQALSPKAQAFLKHSKSASNAEAQSGTLGFLAGAAEATAKLERFGEKPVSGIRFFAYLVDSLLIGVPFIVIALPFFRRDMAGADGQLTADIDLAVVQVIAVKYLCIYAFLRMIYAVSMEASDLQATVGKMLCGIIVTNKQMRKPSLMSVISRNTIARLAFNCIPLNIAHWMMMFHPKKQGVHDMIAGTLVCKRGVAPENYYAGVFA